MSIYIVRHGETNLNKEKRLQGRQSEESLNDRGVIQAEILAKQLSEVDFDIVISSPQKRAIQTAKIISGMNPEVNSKIDVFDLGTSDKIKKDEVDLIEGIPNPKVYHGVENIQDYISRIRTFMDNIKKIKNVKNLNILIVGHKCTTVGIDAYFNDFVNLKESMQKALNNGEYKKYQFDK